MTEDAEVQPNNEQRTIDPKRAGQLGLGGGALAMVVAAYGYLDTNFSAAQTEREGIRAEIQRQDFAASAARRELEIRVERIEERTVSIERAATADRWRGTEMRLWALKFARENPTIVVPDVESD